MSGPRDEVQAPLYENGAATADEYTLDSGIAVMPLAVEPPTNIDELREFSPVVILQLHAPFRIRKAVSSIRKTNNPPVIPAPETTGAFVFLGGTISIQNTLNSSLMNFDWTVATEYSFVENCVSRNQDGFVLMTPPFTLSSQVENAAYSSGGDGGLAEAGAVRYANLDARIGYNQGNAALAAFGTSWSYNTPSYFPGVFFNSDMINGGPNDEVPYLP